MPLEATPAPLEVMPASLEAAPAPLEASAALPSKGTNSPTPAAAASLPAASSRDLKLARKFENLLIGKSSEPNRVTIPEVRATTLELKDAFERRSGSLQACARFDLTP
jgi:hypothetical protein